MTKSEKVSAEVISMALKALEITKDVTMDHREKLAEDWKANLIEEEPDAANTTAENCEFKSAVLRKQTGSSNKLVTSSTDTAADTIEPVTSNYLHDLKVDSSGNIKPLNIIAIDNEEKERGGIGIFGCSGYNRHVTTKILKIKQTKERRKKKGNCDQKSTTGHVD